MKRRWAAFIMTGIIIAGTLALSPAASAGPSGMREASKSRGGGGNARGEARRPRGGGDSRPAASRGGNANRDTPILDALRNGAGQRSGKSDYPLLDAWRERTGNYGDYGDYRRGHHHNDDMADAYRDASIANAVVNLVGIAVGAAVQQNGYAQPVAVAPAPVQVVEVQPRGYYRTEQILVSPGHYEDVRVYEPEGRDAYGRPTGGYYVVHKRWIPEVYEYRPVWVQQ